MIMFVPSSVAQIVVLVDTDGVREGKAVEILADLAQVLARCIELEELRRACHAPWSVRRCA
jgi:acid phosphatase family membrane protein YuiD